MELGVKDWEEVVSGCGEQLVWSEDNGKRQNFGVTGGVVWLEESETKPDDDGEFSLFAVERDDELEREWTSVLQCLDRAEEPKRDWGRGI